ncbi:MAG: hypothetical protein OXH10_06635 [bacterium]|nr:hypothetical protein [bacterium]MCY3580310.1 hypothetical protein [bacterium]MCY3653098.1 hypothetical protein [bacterium]MDE0643610.1 hypothetical protein [bacterium]
MLVAEKPSPNARSHPYRGLSVEHVDETPHPDFIRHHLLGREVYRRTDYIAMVNGDSVGLAAVARAPSDDLFVPVVDVEVWSGPDRTQLIEDPTVDVGNATALAHAAARHGRDGVSGFVIKGKFEHINFIWEPDPVRIFVTELTPPEPPKLLVQAGQVVDFDEDLPPVELVLNSVSFSDLAADLPADSYLLPCRGAGTELDADLSYLDTRPAEAREWVMIGCERSMQFHRYFYDHEPAQVDICPKQRVEQADPGGRWLIKCCMLERGTEYSGTRAVVPWGANLDEVRQAIRYLAGVEAPVAVG